MAPVPSLLLHFDGNSLDSSVYNNPMTLGAEAAIVTTHPRVGSGCLSIPIVFTTPSNPAFIYTPIVQGGPLDILSDSAGDFTIEGWVYLNGVNSYCLFMDYGGDIASNNHDDLQLLVNSDLTGTQVTAFASPGSSVPWSSVSGTGPGTSPGWNYIALIRQSGIAKIYLNGSNISGAGSTWTGYTFPVTPSYAIFGWNFSGTGVNPSFLDEVKVTKGAAVFFPFKNPVGVLFAGPQLKLLSNWGNIQPGMRLNFLQAGSSGPIQLPMTIYQDGALTTPFPTSTITADANGRFPPIYLNPISLLGALRVQGFNAFGQKILDVDPYVPQPSLFYATRVKPAPTSRAANAVLAQDPDLMIIVPGPGTYFFDCLLEVETTGASGLTPGFNLLPEFIRAPFLDHAAASFFWVGNMDGATFGGSSMNPLGNGPAAVFAIAYPLTGGSALNAIHVRGNFSAMGPGNLSVAWSQVTSSASPTTLNAGSYMVVQQLT
jgi:hypothetical protein